MSSRVVTPYAPLPPLSGFGGWSSRLRACSFGSFAIVVSFSGEEFGLLPCRHDGRRFVGGLVRIALQNETGPVVRRPGSRITCRGDLGRPQGSGRGTTVMNHLVVEADHQPSGHLIRHIPERDDNA